MTINNQEISFVKITGFNNVNELICELADSHQTDQEERKIVLSLKSKVKSADCKNNIILEAMSENEMLGFCIMEPREFRDDLDRVFLDYIYVRKDYRGKGIGTELLSASEKMVSESNKNGIFLKVSEDDESVDFFKKHDYSVERILLKKIVQKEENYEIIRKDIKSLTADELKKQRKDFAQLYYENDRAHILSESSTLDEALEQMSLLEEYLAENKAYVFCTYDNEILSGVIWAYPVCDEQDKHMHVKQITVNPEYRNKGIAKQLYAIIFKCMQKNDFFVAKTYVDAANQSAVNFYNKIGYKPIENQMYKKLK